MCVRAHMMNFCASQPNLAEKGVSATKKDNVELDVQNKDLEREVEHHV